MLTEHHARLGFLAELWVEAQRQAVELATANKNLNKEKEQLEAQLLSDSTERNQQNPNSADTE